MKNLERHSEQFEIIKSLKGKVITKITLYLDPEDENYSEQPNPYGLSLFNGIDLEIGNEILSIGNRFDGHNGLSINYGCTIDYEFIEDSKIPVSWDTTIIGEEILSANIYWARNPVIGVIDFYPQEIYFIGMSSILILSSSEINSEEISDGYTDELLVIDKIDIAKRISLCNFAKKKYERRFCFRNVEGLRRSLMRLKRVS